MHISTQINSFQYLGSKFSCLPWLLELLPPSYHFVDVFGGSGVVLLNRELAPIETYNDINSKLVNFFQVLRDQPEELVRVLELTLHSRHEYAQAWYSENDSPLEQARKFFIRTNQSIWAAGGQAETKGWAMAVSQSRTALSEKTHKWLRAVDGLQAIIERFRGVQIECRDFKKVLVSYDGEGTLFYCDSPYDQTLRSSTAYEFDFKNQDFFDLHYLCRNAKGKVAVSGYKTPFMEDLFKDFNQHTGPQRKNSRSNKIAIESLWTNY